MCMWGLIHHSRAIRRKCISLNGKNCTFTWSLPKKVLKSCGRHMSGTAKPVQTDTVLRLTIQQSLVQTQFTITNTALLFHLSLIFVSRLHYQHTSVLPHFLVCCPDQLDGSCSVQRAKSHRNLTTTKFCWAEHTVVLSKQSMVGERDPHPAKILVPPPWERVIADPAAPCSERSSRNGWRADQHLFRAEALPALTPDITFILSVRQELLPISDYSAFYQPVTSTSSCRGRLPDSEHSQKEKERTTINHTPDVHSSSRHPWRIISLFSWKNLDGHPILLW